MSVVSQVFNFPPSQFILRELKKDPILVNKKYDSILQIVAVFFDCRNKTINLVQRDFEKGLDGLIHLELSRIQPLEQVELLERIQSIVLQKFSRSISKSESSSSSTCSSFVYQDPLDHVKNSLNRLDSFPKATIVPAPSSSSSSASSAFTHQNPLEYEIGFYEGFDPAHQATFLSDASSSNNPTSSSFVYRDPLEHVKNSLNKLGSFPEATVVPAPSSSTSLLARHDSDEPNFGEEESESIDLSALAQVISSPRLACSGSDEYEELFGRDSGALGLESSSSSSSSEALHPLGTDSSINEGKIYAPAQSGSDDDDPI